MRCPRKGVNFIVHFNPWLVGERDALLRHFLTRISEAIKLSDYAKDGKKAARELKAYSKVFDVVRLIPGAEPWASLVKAVVEAVGETTGSIAEYKAPDIEGQKRRVEDALRKFARPIVVFIDDIDRLFALEVFEMVRIVKAVGGLPNIGYVLAWDPAYVTGALASLDVPQADTYVDKIVQVRMPLPNLSFSARGRLINEALSELPTDAVEPRFDGDTNRLSSLYFSGLRELLEQPRDITRVFNAVRILEPTLRGEVSFADIVGLAALMVKAAPVFELLRKHPIYFVGRLPKDYGLLDREVNVVDSAQEKRKEAYDRSSLPADVQRVVHFLFPKVAKSEGGLSSDTTSAAGGRLAHPARLLVALQRSISPSDVSLDFARQYLQEPERRRAVAVSLTQENCLEFLELLGDVVESLSGEVTSDLEELCLAIARLADEEPFVARARARSDVFAVRASDVALRCIGRLLRRVDEAQCHAIAVKIVESPNALCVAADIVARSFLGKPEDREGNFIVPLAIQRSVVKRFSGNVLQASKEDRLLELADPGAVLFVMAQVAPESCPNAFKALRASDQALDRLAQELLRHSFDSVKGQTFGPPDTEHFVTSYCSLDELKSHGRRRLADDSLTYPARAAWRAVVEGKKLYAVDGTPAR